MGQLQPGGGQTAAVAGVTRRLTPAWPVMLVVLAVLAVLSLAVMIPLSVVSRQPGDGLVALVIGVPYACVGAVVARRQPRNPLGWLFLAIAVCLFLSTIGGDYAVLAYRLGRHLPFAAVGLALDQLWSDGLVLFVLAILLFPDGRLPPGFWRWALRGYCAVYGMLFAAFAVATAQALAARPIGVDATGGLSAVDNPAGWFAVAQRLGLLLLIAMALAFIGRQVLNWRRSSGDRRQQLK